MVAALAVRSVVQGNSVADELGDRGFMAAALLRGRRCCSACASPAAVRPLPCSIIAGRR
jgi:hypothetical protein